MYAIETSNLSKTFNGHVDAVNQLSLKVPKGSIYGFLGPNGAGKTTTIKLLTGLIKPSEGTIKLYGEKVKFGKSLKHNVIGLLPDVPEYYSWMDAKEFLYLSGELFNMNRKELKLRVDNLLNLVGLSNVKTKLKGYSRGMKQRLGIAQALINKPKIVFLDEPTSALDPIGRKEILELIVKLKDEATVFFSTHILSDVERICDRAAIMNKGNIVIEDKIDNLKEEFSTGNIVLTIEQGKRDIAINAFKKIEWISLVTPENDNSMILKSTNIETAQKNIPKVLFENDIALIKMESKEPTLEEIFVKVVNQ